MNISQDKTALINDLKQRYQYCFHSDYPEEILSFEEETGLWSDDFYEFFLL
ncbi:YxiJ-like family protein [Bacillus safensis]|uniref:YxiJ-like family protein n=1 Tax=Bacillus safensis TaxID=561879 RepID=UPI001F2809B2|nr:YxiJ-like family protein [Bacillus safensis]UIN49024.1 YxiJ-like family protein [Bacillus safensis]